MRQSEEVDFFVIGGGSGGVRAARMAGALGLRVVVAEEARLGGTCVNVGCIPKKLMVYAAEFGDDFEDAAGFGWTVGKRSFDWESLISAKDTEIRRLNGVYRRLLEGAGVTIVEGRARFVDAHTLVVGDRQFRAKTILVATGGHPVRPEVPGAEHYLISDDVFVLEKLPERVLIVGGGYIAVEFAGIFRGLGSAVTIAYRGPLFLRGFDDDVRRELATEMRKRGIELLFDCDVTALERLPGGAVTVKLSTGGERTVDVALAATGRLPATRGIGLEEVGIDLDEIGAVRVDSLLRSSVKHVFAIGDCTHRLNLTPVALAEGMAVVATAFRDKPTAVDYADVPTAVFSQPTLARVGFTEAEARERLAAVDVYRSGFRPLKLTLSGRDERTFMKLIVDRASDRVVGAHMVGNDAGEIIQGIAIAIRAGATKAQFDTTIGIHPTAAEEFVTMREKAPEPA